ncbi:hypothetical protein ACYZUD_14720 [Pseudomonas sp. XS1P51]
MPVTPAASLGCPYPGICSMPGVQSFGHGRGAEGLLKLAIQQSGARCCRADAPDGASGVPTPVMQG